MDVKSYFFPAKPEEPTLPKPLTVREILEDLDNAGADDPVIQFGLALRKRGSRRFSLETVTHIEDEANFEGSPLQPIRKTSQGFAASPRPSSPLNHIRSSDNKQGGNISRFQKFKTVVDTSEKVHDAIHEIEAKIKHFEDENQSFIKSLGSPKR